MRLKTCAPRVSQARCSARPSSRPDRRSRARYPVPAAPELSTATPVATKASSSLTVRSVRRTVMAGKAIVVRGTLRPAGAGRAVSLQLAKDRGGWRTVDHDRTDRHGRYILVWRAARTGTKRVRVHFGGTRDLSSARHLAGTARIYRRALASWYGPGLYGGHLGLRRHAEAGHARRGQQVAALRHEGHAALPRPHRPGPRRRPRPLCRRTRVRPDRRDEGPARLRLDGHSADHALAFALAVKGGGGRRSSP